MNIFRFDRAETVIERFGSSGARATRLAAGDGQVHLTCLTIQPGGSIGRHPAPATQFFMVVSGEGWVAGPSGEHVPITAGLGVRWESGEVHASGTATGLTVLALEGASLELLESGPHVRRPQPG
ncbi:MAG: cupin domain-containing protein [Candidatus Dormibacteraeota bacterium]|nr:cupin domain-containing protein [Candidatus Dormibacteraeota bacterium]